MPVKTDQYIAYGKVKMGYIWNLYKSFSNRKMDIGLDSNLIFNN